MLTCLSNLDNPSLISFLDDFICVNLAITSDCFKHILPKAKLSKRHLLDYDIEAFKYVKWYSQLESELNQNFKNENIDSVFLSSGNDWSCSCYWIDLTFIRAIEICQYIKVSLP